MFAIGEQIQQPGKRCADVIASLDSLTAPPLALALPKPSRKRKRSPLWEQEDFEGVEEEDEEKTDDLDQSQALCREDLEQLWHQRPVGAQAASMVPALKKRTTDFYEQCRFVRLPESVTPLVGCTVVLDSTVGRRVKFQGVIALVGTEPLPVHPDADPLVALEQTQLCHLGEIRSSRGDMFRKEYFVHHGGECWWLNQHACSVLDQRCRPPELLKNATHYNQPAICFFHNRWQDGSSMMMDSVFYGLNDLKVDDRVDTVNDRIQSRLDEFNQSPVEHLALWLKRKRPRKSSGMVPAMSSTASQDDSSHPSSAAVVAAVSVSIATADAKKSREKLPVKQECKQVATKKADLPKQAIKSKAPARVSRESAESTSSSSSSSSTFPLVSLHTLAMNDGYLVHRRPVPSPLRAQILIRAD